MPEPTTQQEREAPCMECGMVCKTGEFHPFAACLMFKACHNGGLVRDSLKFVAEKFPRSLPPADAPSVRELQQDASRWRMLVKILCYGLRGAGYGRKFKLVEVSQMYGDESEVSSITTLIDAALAQQERGKQ